MCDAAYSTTVLESSKTEVVYVEGVVVIVGVYLAVDGELEGALLALFRSAAMRRCLGAARIQRAAC